MINISDVAQFYRRVGRSNYGESYQRDSVLISSSIESQFIPFFSIVQSEKLVVNNTPFNIYCIPSTSNHAIGSSVNHTRKLEEWLNTNSPTHYMHNVIIKDNRMYYIMRHCIYEIVDGTPIILFLLIIEDNYWRTSAFGDSTDYSKLRLLINSQFTIEERKAMYNYVRKYIVPQYINLGVDIIYTPDITRYCFKNLTLPITFSTIAERRNLSNDLTQRVLNELFS